jgi:CRISPR-associated protein Csx3
MKNLKLTWIPTSEGFQILDVLLEGNGVLDPKELVQVVLPGEPDWREGVLVNGRGPIWLYAHLVHLCHPAAWVATVDPRQGGVVVQCHIPNGPAVGTIIPHEAYRFYLGSPAPAPRPPASSSAPQGARLAFVGPPHSGKTVLMNALRQALQRALPGAVYQRDVFIVRACPDGEGDWFAEIPPEEARLLRYKHPFDPDFVQQAIHHIEEASKSKRLVLVDCGGRIDRFNQDILNQCSHGLIVSSDPDAVGEWQGALKSSGVQVLGVVHSHREARSEVTATDPFTLHFGPLERGHAPALPEALVKTVASLVS